MEMIWSANASSVAPTYDPSKVETGFAKDTAPFTTPGWETWHMLMSELCAILTLNGVAPDKTKLDQIGKLIKTISDNAANGKDRANELLLASMPIGTIIPWLGNTAPPNFVFSQGQRFAVTDPVVTELVAAINQYKATNQFLVTTEADWQVWGFGKYTLENGFVRLPDLRGLTLKGAGMGGGYTTNPGRVAGSIEGDGNKWHTHGYSDYYYSENLGVNWGWTGSNRTDNDNAPIGTDRTTYGDGNNETTVRNVSVNWCVRTYRLNGTTSGNSKFTSVPAI